LSPVKIGVFGGSFDPVHHGHLAAAEQAMRRLRLDQVRFVPARQQPLKPGGHAAAAEHRIAMLERAIRGHPGFGLDRSEIDRPGPSYTVDTLRALRVSHPNDQLFLIVGADAARDLGQWCEADRLPELAQVVVVTRPGASPPRHPLIAQVIEIPAVDVSATAVREAVRRGESIPHLVPRGVEEYIAAHGLYRSGG
ncbi:MAG: nicotinate-nucleotide adenylyltransferase, partial [bacterium]